MTARARKKKPARKRTARASKTSAPETGAGSAARAVASGAGVALRSAGTAVAWLGRHAGRGVACALRSRDVQRLCAIALLAGAFGFVSHAVREDVESWPQFAVTTDGLRDGPVPAGLSPRIREELAKLPLPRPTGSFDRRLVPFTAALLEDLDWIEEVREVRIAPPAQLTFSIRTRRPVARLEADVLTADAQVISSSYAAHPERLPRVTGVPTAGPARQRALEAAVSVLGDLGETAVQVDRVDVSGLVQASREGGVLLTLSSGPTVEWGRPSSDPRPHLPGESKRGALEEFLEGGVDLDTVERISLRWDETTYVLSTGDALASARR